MVLRRTNGLHHPLHQLRDEMDRLVGSYLAPVTATVAERVGLPSRAFPAVNVWEEEEALHAEAEVPGVKSEDLEVSVVGNVLTVHGRRSEQHAQGMQYHRQERSFGEFNRVLRLPVDIDADKVEATLKNGVLLIKLPKAESAKPKKIKVSPAG